MKKYIVTKHHVTGFLKGMNTTETTTVKFEIGKRYGDYICIECKEI